MSEGLAALLGALVGGILSFLGTVGVARFQARREQERLARERLQENIYILQEAIDPVFGYYYAALEARWVRLEITKLPNPDLASSVRRLNLLSVRVGDDVLGNHLGAILETLAKARNAESQAEAFAAYNSAHDLLRPVLIRMGELLHTDAKVDLGLQSRHS